MQVQPTQPGKVGSNGNPLIVKDFQQGLKLHTHARFLARSMHMLSQNSGYSG
jgi:hypothetical protein